MRHCSSTRNCKAFAARLPSYIPSMVRNMSLRTTDVGCLSISERSSSTLVDPYMHWVTWKELLYDKAEELRINTLPILIVKLARMMDSAWEVGQQILDQEFNELEELFSRHVRMEVEPGPAFKYYMERKRSAGWTYLREFEYLALLSHELFDSIYYTFFKMKCFRLQHSGDDQRIKVRKIIPCMVENNYLQALPAFPYHRGFPGFYPPRLLPWDLDSYLERSREFKIYRPGDESKLHQREVSSYRPAGLLGSFNAF